MLDRNPSTGNTNQNDIRAAIIARMAVFQVPEAAIVSATTSLFCNSSIESHGTACLDEVAMWHEDKVHVPACNSSPKTALGAREAQTTVDYAREEIAGYTAEIARIKETLRNLPATCRPSGWIGAIYYFEKKEVETTSQQQPDMTVVSGVERSKRVFQRSANVIFKEGANATTVGAAAISPRASVALIENISHYQSTTGRISCIGGAATPAFTGTSTGTSLEETESRVSEEKDIDASFEYDDQTGAYTLSFVFPALTASGTYTKTDTVTGACNPADNGTTSGSASASLEYPAESIIVSGKLPPSNPPPDHLSGADPVMNTPPVTAPNMTATGSAKVSWSLTRLP